MADRARCRARPPRTEFFGMGILLFRDANTKASMDGPGFTRRKHAALDLSHIPSGHRPHAARLDGTGTMDRGGNKQPARKTIGKTPDEKLFPFCDAAPAIGRL